MPWIVANTISWSVGMTIGFTVWYMFAGDLTLNPATGLTSMDPGAGGWLGSLILALSVGFGQYLIVRGRLPQAKEWFFSSAAGLFIGSLFASFLGQPILQYSDSFIRLGFDLPPLWLPSSFCITTFQTGGPFSGLILGLGIAAGQAHTFLQYRSGWFRWLTASALSLAFAFSLGIFVSKEILVTGAITGFIYGLSTFFPLKRLLDTSNIEAASSP